MQAYLKKYETMTERYNLNLGPVKTKHPQHHYESKSYMHQRGTYLVLIGVSLPKYKAYLDGHLSSICGHCADAKC
ncbi:hypothetical protein TSUD_260500 [Trifolium subterraneum]|uniref:Uncharacterized protein n=1 Tax=Trifolium subterraneum TaxID=3900 RepID=A0A2Z6PER8_TRISU|nr:hypothetical protein TSUD_260500 [Trifolium subterraneum]